MFETKFSETPSSRAAPSGSQTGELRAFDWAELCARIAASSELRRVVASARNTGGFADFTAESVLRKRANENYERAINLDASKNYKPCSAKQSGTNPEPCKTPYIDRNER